jgi:hypothetical protein
MNLNLLNQLIKETVESDFRSNAKKSKHLKNLREGLRKAKRLIEEKGDAEDKPADADKSSSVDNMDIKTDINKMNPEELAAAAFGGAGSDALFNTMTKATGWASKALKGVSVTDSKTLGDQAKKIWSSESELADRLKNINKALAASQGFDKSEMPAFEKNDFLAIKDALDATDGGDLAVDFQDDYKDDEKSAMSYHDKKSKKDPEGKEDSEIIADGYNRWNKLAGVELLKEINADDRFPFPGAHQVMPGAANRGGSTESDFSLGDTSGLAKTFLTKGEGTGDKTGVSDQVSMANSIMKPTQKNIKAAKSLLFAFADAGLEMEGSFADQDGNILDGHHRWSGQHLRSGGETTHTGVHIIQRPSGMDIPTFLTMLTSIGNALGRPTKK